MFKSDKFKIYALGFVSAIIFIFAIIGVFSVFNIGNNKPLPVDNTIKNMYATVYKANDHVLNRFVAVKVLNEEFITDIEFIRRFKPNFVIDAIDSISPKIALIKYCVEHKIPHVTAMGAGAKLDATQIRIADLSKSYNCPLAYILRKKLRKEGISKGFKVVFSEELPDRDAIVPVEERNKKSQVGTISYLPAVFGCVCAQAAIEHLIKE